jgi:hypothetical protein
MDLFLHPPFRLAELASIADGMEQDAAYEIKDVVQESSSDEDEFRLITTGLIDPFVSHWGKREVRYLHQRFQKPVLRGRDILALGHRKMLDQGRAEKIAVGGLGTRIEAVVDSGKSLVSKSAFVIRLTDEEVCPYAVTAVLNCGLMNVLYDAAFAAAGFGAGSKNYRPPTLGYLPMPHRESLMRDGGSSAESLSRLGRELHHKARKGLDAGDWERLDLCVRRAFGLAAASTDGG